MYLFYSYRSLQSSIYYINNLLMTLQHLLPVNLCKYIYYYLGQTGLAKKSFTKVKHYLKLALCEVRMSMCQSRHAHASIGRPVSDVIQILLVYRAILHRIPILAACFSSLDLCDSVLCLHILVAGINLWIWEQKNTASFSFITQSLVLRKGSQHLFQSFRQFRFVHFH
jgi:hypothetical protein